jgi:acyl-CoA synthetase (NDP forming)
MREWTVYSRPDCTLCTELIVELAQLLGAAAVHAKVVDITDDAELERKYGQRIPVLLADGEFVCAYRLDEERVRAYL